MFEKKYVLLQKVGSVWWPEKKNDPYLRNLALIFEEVAHYLDCFIEVLRDPTWRGYGGNKVDIDFYDNKVQIMFTYSDDPEKYAFVIDKERLIKIIRAWQKLVKQEPKEITIYQDGDEYTLEGLLENGEKITDIVF